MGPGFESPEVHQISWQRIYYIVEVETKSTGKQTRSSFPVTNRLVFLTHRVHLYPFRTQKLSCAEPKILARRRAGKIGQCQPNPKGLPSESSKDNKRINEKVGVFTAQGPPVPIPNTEVKLC